jgi:hypothetical protein
MPGQMSAQPVAEVIAEPADYLESEDLDDADFQQMMAGSSGPLGGSMGAVAPGEWTPSTERPVIRPPVGANPALRGRSSGGMQRVSGGSSELGVEESEFDRPTFIRRGIIPPG